MVEDLISSIIWFVLRILFWPVFLMAQVAMDVICFFDKPSAVFPGQATSKDDRSPVWMRATRWFVGFGLLIAVLALIGLVLTAAFWLGWLPWWLVFFLAIGITLAMFSATVLAIFGIGSKAIARKAP